MSVRDRVREHRRRMRERGFRPVQIWVPDIRTEEFAAEAHRRAVLVARADRTDDSQEFIAAVSVSWHGE